MIARATGVVCSSHSLSNAEREGCTGETGCLVSCRNLEFFDGSPDALLVPHRGKRMILKSMDWVQRWTLA